MTTLVTGAGGFLGGALARRLLGQGESVRALVRRRGDAAALEGAELVEGDVRDPAAMARAVRGCERVFHLAGLISRRQAARAEFRAVNATGSEVVARAAASAGARRFVLASSTSVYGGLTRRHGIREETSLGPDTAYGRSKADAERLVRRVSAQTGIEAVVGRIGTTLGPSRRAWSALFEDVAAGRCRLVGRGENHHHWGHVDDLVEGLILCAEVPAAAGRAYTLTGPEPAPLRQILDWIAEATGGPAPPVSRLPLPVLALYGQGNRVVEALTGLRLPRSDRAEFFLGDRTFDLSRARDELGHAPRVPLREAIRRTAEWLAGSADPSGSPARA